MSSGDVQRAPDVLEVTGMYFDPQSDLVSLQYRSEEQVCEVRFPVAEILRAEDWFIQLRRRIAANRESRRDRRPER